MRCGTTLTCQTAIHYHFKFLVKTPVHAAGSVKATRRDSESDSKDRVGDEHRQCCGTLAVGKYSMGWFW